MGVLNTSDVFRKDQWNRRVEFACLATPLDIRQPVCITHFNFILRTVCTASHSTGTSTAVVGSAVNPEEVLTIDPGQECVGPDGQHSDSGL